MRILISNDDGYQAEGVHVLARAMAGLGEVTVVAPKTHQSGMSAAVSLGKKKLVYKELRSYKPGQWSYLDGTPASCVKFGLEFRYERRNPDLVICGINHGSNASSAANYSGTLGAAAEGAINGIKSIAVSLCDHRPDADFSAVERVLPALVQQLLSTWPQNRPGLYYNINFPALPLSEIKGIRVSRQGVGRWIREFEVWVWESEEALQELEEGEKAYFMSGDFIDGETSAEEADHRLNEDGWISITPCQIDLTDYAEYKRLQSVDFNGLFKNL